MFRPIGKDFVLALRARAGVVKAPETEVSSGTVRYVPPEQRFYAGGANDVRGYERNELGPVVYVVLDTTAVPDADGQYPPGTVQVSPIGGNYSLVLNAELRVPSPVFRNRMRFGVFVDGGRLDDPTATATSGGKWYAYPHIAVNAVGDFIVGYSQFSSVHHPGAGYSRPLAMDPAGTLRDPVIYKPGEDYYHKDFGSGRNRWGDFSQAQVDPSPVFRGARRSSGRTSCSSPRRAQ